MIDVNCFLELRKALQLFLGTLDPDTQVSDMMAVATVFPAYEVGKSYKIKDVFSFGTNSVDDPQLYMVLQAHTSSAEWPPDAVPSLYKAIGVTKEGYPEWVQPLGAIDTYNKGDVVSHNDVLYESTIDNNASEPGVYGWKVAL